VRGGESAASLPPHICSTLHFYRGDSSVRSTRRMTSNVTRVPPRRYQVNYKGLHGWVEYAPSLKKWRWSFKAQMTIKHDGETETKDHAELEMKKFMDVAAVSKNLRSVD
jgi:hypothetical protein